MFVHMTSGQYSEVAWFSRGMYLFYVKPPKELNMTKNRVYFIPCSWGKVHKGETCRPLKARLEEHRKAVVQVDIEKSGMADHIWKKKGKHLLSWDEVI